MDEAGRHPKSQSWILSLSMSLNRSSRLEVAAKQFASPIYTESFCPLGDSAMIATVDLDLVIQGADFLEKS